MSMMCVKPGEGDAGCCPKYHLDPNSVVCNPPLEYCPSGPYDPTNPMIAGNSGCTNCRDTPSKCFDMTMDLWLDHCLDDGDSMFARALLSDPSDIVVQKGFRHMEMFSGFYDNTRNYMTDLHDTLQQHGVTEIFVGGIATTHCVRWTVQ